MGEVARLLMLLWKIGEYTKSQRKPKPVFVFFDHSCREHALALRNEIETYMFRNKIKCTQIAAIILYAERKVDLKETSEMEKVYILKAKLDSSERDDFGSKLNQLQQKHKFSPDDMLSFVIMCENFNDDSEFVRRVVRNNMRGIRTQNPKQDRMLSILACMKYFSDGNLLESICEKFLITCLYFSTMLIL